MGSSRTRRSGQGAPRVRRGPLQTSPSKAAPGTETVIALQRSVGNKATAHAIEEVRNAGAMRQGSGIAPAMDYRAEREADLVADRALSRLDPRGISQSGGSTVPPALAAALSPDLGNLGGVRFDSSPKANAEADRMGARAFSDNGRVAFGSEQMDLGSREGVHLAAHEAAHGALHHSGTGNGGTSLVHAKLRGTREAIQSMGGGPGTTGLRKKIGWLKNWDKILAGLGAYEQIEDGILSTGTATSQSLTQMKPKMIGTLSKVESASIAWQKSNDHVGQLKKTETQHTSALNMGVDVNEDERTKAAKRQAVAMLLPRIRTEMSDVAAGNWNATLGLSDAQLAGKGREDSGQMNTVSELHYKTETGDFSGFFKSEKGFVGISGIAGHDLESGIRQADPNYGARSMAMYRLDQLLKAGVTARVEFAAHDGKLGTVLESSKGTRATDTQFAVNGGQGGKNAPSAEDATLQQCLNKLQILDAIAAQLDRHAGNYFVQSDDSGKVTGVTGIDLDMSFGADVTTPDSAPKGAFNYRGMPEEIDQAFGEHILTISDDQVRAAITGLLSPSEVEATVSRFQFVKDRVQVAKDTGLLQASWGADSAKSQRPQKPEDLAKPNARKNYASDVANIAVENGAAAARLAGADLLRTYTNVLPPETLAQYNKALVPIGDRWHQGVVYELVLAAMQKGSISSDAAEQAGEALVEAVMDDSSMRDRFEVAIQEQAKVDHEGGPADPTVLVIASAQANWPSVLARFLRAPSRT